MQGFIRQYYFSDTKAVTFTDEASRIYKSIQKISKGIYRILSTDGSLEIPALFF